MREPQLAGTRVRPPLIVEASGSRSLVHALGSTVVRLARVGARRTCLAVGPAYATSTTEVCAEMYRYYAPAIVLVDAGAEAATDGQLSRLGSVSALCAASVDTGQGTSTTGPAPVVATNTAGGWLDDAAAAKVPSGWGRGAANKKGGARWTDPANPGNGVRIDQGNPLNAQITQQVDHIVVALQRSGHCAQRSTDHGKHRSEFRASSHSADGPEPQTWNAWFAP